jgi:rfaE bifunctional protein kinase chain/domain
MTTSEILAAFSKLSALVLGDICLDRWCSYDPELCQASRETGIPRVGVVRTEVTAGAGGTVANNLVALGLGRVAVLGVAGDDGHGLELKRALGQQRISSEMLLLTSKIATFTYTKLINAATDKEDQPRIDFISTVPLDAQVERQVLDFLSEAIDSFDVILVADQAETSVGGVVTPAIRDILSEQALRYPGKVFWADSRERMELFRNIIVKSNQEEAVAACHRAFGRLDLQALREYCHAKLLIVTDGPQGAVIVASTGEQSCPTKAVEEPVDICGAGDAFSAGAAAALAVTGLAAEAVRFGNLVASITIMKRGTGTASPAEVLTAARG